MTIKNLNQLFWIFKWAIGNISERRCWKISTVCERI